MDFSVLTNSALCFPVGKLMERAQSFTLRICFHLFLHPFPFHSLCPQLRSHVLTEESRRKKTGSGPQEALWFQEQ